MTGFRRTDRVSFVSPPTVFGETAVEFTPLLTPQSKAFVKQSGGGGSVDLGDDGSIVPSPHTTNVYVAPDNEFRLEPEVDYDKQLDLELEKMILGEDERVQRMEAAISSSRKSSLLKARNYSGRLSDRSLPSLASLADMSSQFSDSLDDALTDVSPSVVMTSNRTSSTEEKQSPAAQISAEQPPIEPLLDVEERMLLPESVLRQLTEDDDFIEEVFEDSSVEDSKKPTSSNIDKVVVEAPQAAAEQREQEVPDGVADSWEDIDDEELEKVGCYQV